MASNFLPEKYREYLGLGVEIAVSILLPIFVGYVIDIYFKSSPWGLLIGALIGIITFFFTVFRIARKLDIKKRE